MVVVDVGRKDVAQMFLVPHNHMIKTVMTDGSDHPLNERTLPGRSVGGEDLLNAHPLQPCSEDLAILLVSVAEKVFRSRVPGKSLHDLPDCPLGGWMGSDIEMEDVPSSVTQDHKHIEDFERKRWDGEEINGDHVHHMVLQKGSPRLRAWPAFASGQGGSNSQSRVSGSKVSACHISIWLIAVLGVKLHY
jgi:hypothetical protein